MSIDMALVVIAAFCLLIVIAWFTAAYVAFLIYRLCGGKQGFFQFVEGRAL